MVICKRRRLPLTGRLRAFLTPGSSTLLRPGGGRRGRGEKPCGLAGRRVGRVRGWWRVPEAGGRRGIGGETGHPPAGVMAGGPQEGGPEAAGEPPHQSQ